MYPVLLKILACICMLADHIGVFTDGTLYIVLRSVGRISFPLFTFLLAQGYHHTHSKRRYLARLFLCGILSEVPYNLCFSGTVYAPGSINVLFTLSLGLCAFLPGSDSRVSDAKAELFRRSRRPVRPGMLHSPHSLCRVATYGLRRMGRSPDYGNGTVLPTSGSFGNGTFPVFSP